VGGGNKPSAGFLIHCLSWHQTGPSYNQQKSRKMKPGEDASSPPFSSLPGFCRPSPFLYPGGAPTLTHGPAYLHEVPMVFQHTAGCLPGVLVALPWVHPTSIRERLPLVNIQTLFLFLPSTDQGAMVMLCA
jgi:hypothetical protein